MKKTKKKTKSSENETEEFKRLAKLGGIAMMTLLPFVVEASYTDSRAKQVLDRWDELRGKNDS